MKKSLRLFIFVGVFLGFFVAGTAFAGMTFDLNIGNEALSVGPWAKVMVDDPTLTGADVTVTAYGNYLFNAFGINPSAGYTGYISVSPGSFTEDFPSPKNMDGFGTYSLIFKGPNMAQAVSSLSFTLLGTWANAADVLDFNADGYLAAAHIAMNDGTGNTGFASAVPIPAAVWLLGFGVVGLVGAKRRIN